MMPSSLEEAMNLRSRGLTAAMFIGALLTAGTLQTPQAAAGGGASCEGLTSLALQGTTITAAQVVAAGAFTPPAANRGGTGRGGAVYAALPSFCRLAATLKPTSDSDIKIEVWLPAAASWNGKFQAVGNGGWAGSISYPALAQAVARGYATASTDTGHAGNTAAFAVGHPEKVIDIGYRAVHEMTIEAKAIINAFYGTAPKVSFWNGCSLGGRQGITEAQRYPADYDAIVAGAPAVNTIRLHGARMAINQIVHRSDDSYIPPEKYSMIHQAVLESCDALDGVKDGVIENPTRCRFDPRALACKGADGPTCLTPAQVETAKALYAPIKNPKSGAQIFPALLLPGSDEGWRVLAGPEPISTALEAFRYVVFQDANWDWHHFNPASDIDLALKADHGVLDSGNANLQWFVKRGGKLLMYHGWADPQVAALNSVDYFNNVTRELGKGVVGTSIQLYMVPGMAHCQGGPGTDTFDKMAAIEQWVGTGASPADIVASHATDGKVDRTRPLCPYGKVAKWNGSGSTDDAASFVCAGA
jgi:feruloyl esterase